MKSYHLDTYIHMLSGLFLMEMDIEYWDCKDIQQNYHSGSSILVVLPRLEDYKMQGSYKASRNFLLHSQI